MSVTLMAASCDSIGSCSLDVDAESLNGSLIDSAQVDSSHKHRKPGELKVNAPSLSEQTLHSLLLSAGTNSGGQLSDNLDSSQANLNSPSPSAKKPSYLNLACSISGYGGITTYDSKLREGFRSRDHSPGKLIGIQNGSREASPARGLAASSGTSGNLLSAPNSGRLCWTPSPVGHASIKPDMKHISPTIGGRQRFNGMNGSDQTDATANFNGKRMSDQRNRWLESALSPLEKSNDYQQVVTVIESKSGRHGVTTETAVETRYEVNSTSRSTVMSSKTVISSSSLPQQYSSSLQTERIIPISVESDRNGHTSGISYHTNGSVTHHTPVSSKSFIQQRVERLYGPCALAQGFFHRSVKSSFSSPPNSLKANGVYSQIKTEEKLTPERQTKGSPELPVLRHLRPEFREQLTVAPRRSFGTRISNGSPPSNSLAPKLTSSTVQESLASNSGDIQWRTSTESLADLQPAAPVVVLPQQSPTISPMTKSDKDSVHNDEPEPVCPTKTTQEIKPVLKTNDDVSPMPTAVSYMDTKAVEKEENAGHKFLRIQRQTIEKVLELAQKAEREIEEDGLNGKPQLSEEALGHLRAAAGQARLLVTQKMVQFEGLCRKCINQHKNEPFPTTPEDLQGFWDMLLLQVDQVHNTFQRLDKLKAVDWCEEKLAEDQPKSPESSGVRTPSSASKRAPRTSKTPSVITAKSAEAVALRKQREEERRKLMEQRRRELKQKQQSGENASATEETVEIFGAQSS